MPIRVQLKRTKGWKLPPNTVCVTRPGIFGNPFTVAGYLEVWNPKATPEEAREACVRFYKDWISEVMSGVWRHHAKTEAIRCAVPTLKGKNLACWCKEGDLCHADVLLEIANREQV